LGVKWWKLIGFFGVGVLDTIFEPHRDAILDSAKEHFTAKKA
jgi:hypothetical protein